MIITGLLILLLLSGSVDETVKTFDGNSYELVNKYEGHQLGVISVDSNHLGTHVISSSLDSQIRIWDLYKTKTFDNLLLKTIDPG